MNRTKLLLLCLVAFLVTLPAHAIDRRKNQYPTDSAYGVFPYVVTMPGLGTFYGVGGTFANINDSEMDFIINTLSGDQNGMVLSVTDVPIFSKHLTVDYFGTSLNKSALNFYRRGISSTKEQYDVIFMDKVNIHNLQANLKLWDKRIHIYAGNGRGDIHMTGIGDPLGNVTPLNLPEFNHHAWQSGFIFDYTDDRNDPRKGVRFEGRTKGTPTGISTDPDYYVLDQAASFYLPVGISTWAFTAWASDAIVKRQGATDPATVASLMGYDCNAIPVGPAKTACQADLTMRMDEKTRHNTYGDASSLGGTFFGRAYPQGRFYAAHTRFYGSEYRWNFPEINRPFNILFASGVETSNQIALFYETGTVADTVDQLGQKWATAYGLGYRMLLSSGNALRIDYAMGPEGPQLILFFGYPWGLYY